MANHIYYLFLYFCYFLIMKFKNHLVKFLEDESGATAIEYGLICSLVFLAIVAALNNFATKSGVMYNNIAAAMK
jgi:pilus assembly protein Flp/PilA